jgi:hypothetical protein
MSVPFGERGGALRGFLDAVCGRLPRFVSGGGLPDSLLPVFHFHDVTADELEPKLRYLAENNYQTTTADEIARFARGEIHFHGPRVALCFDDAWASLWTVAAPLLKRHNLTAITYAIPARIEEAPACRPTETAAPGPVLSTWPELRALHASGVVDVQCHTESHSMMFSSNAVIGFVTPEYAQLPMLNRPQLSPPPALCFLEPDQLGAPLYETRSRMSDGRRVEVSLDLQARCVDVVAREGGPGFFAEPDWEDRLRRAAGSNGNGASVKAKETDAERDRAIDLELEQGRAILNDRLRTTTVNHICLPWGVSSGYTAAALKRIGYRSAFANRMRGLFAVRPGDDPYWLKRLPNRYILRLPGRGRRTWI